MDAVAGKGSRSLKYAHVERERRWLLAAVPDALEIEWSLAIADRYLVGTRLRLRETVADDGAVVRKLGHKVRLADGPEEIACTSVYLDDAEWAALSVLEARPLRKVRRRARVGGVSVSLDVFEGDCAGLVLVEIDRGDGPDAALPAGLSALAEVTADEAFTGAELAAASRDQVRASMRRHGACLG